MKKKRWMKRIASAVLTAAMVVSQIGVWNTGWGQEVVKAEETNLFSNGGFESDYWENWNISAKNQDDNTEGKKWSDIFEKVENTVEYNKTGDKSLLVKTSIGDDVYVTCKNDMTSKLTPGKTYTLSGYIKVIEDPENDVWIYKNQITVGSDWTQFSTDYTATDENNYPWFVIWSPKGTTFCVDDLSLIEKEEDTDTYLITVSALDSLGNSIASTSADGFDAVYTVPKNMEVTLNATTYINDVDAGGIGAGNHFYWWAEGDNKDSISVKIPSESVDTIIQCKEPGEYEIDYSWQDKDWKHYKDGKIKIIATESDLPDPDMEEVDHSTDVKGSLDIDKVSNLNDSYIMGMDISSMISEIQSGVVYKDYSGEPLYSYDGSDDSMLTALTNVCKFLRDNGITDIRIRVWNDPYTTDDKGYGGGNNDVEKAAIFAKAAQTAGLNMLVDFHCSDFWCDPGKQKAPKGWENDSLETKKTKLDSFIYSALQQIDAGSGVVTMVQVGNETTQGFVGEKTAENMCELYKTGIAAVTRYKPTIKTVIHLTNPESGTMVSWAKTFAENGVDYDILATSYYPYWHGTLENLKYQFKLVKSKYGKDCMVAETSYANTLDDTDGHDNTVRAGSNDSVDDCEWPFSNQGQATFLRELINTVNQAGGLGVFYWEGAWITVGNTANLSGDAYTEKVNDNKEIWKQYGSGWASEYSAEYDPDDAGKWFGGSAVDNQAFFSADGTALSSLNVYNYVKTGAKSGTVSIEKIEEPSKTYYLGDAVGNADLPKTLDVYFATGTVAKNVTWKGVPSSKKVGTYQIEGTIQLLADEVPTTGAYVGKTTLPVTFTYIVKQKNVLNSALADFSDETLYTLSQESGSMLKCNDTDKNDVVEEGNPVLHWFCTEAREEYVTTKDAITLTADSYQLQAEVQGYANDFVKLQVLEAATGNVLYESEVDDGKCVGHKNFKYPSISFQLTEQKNLKIKIIVNCNAGGWGTVDNLYLYRVNEDEIKEQPSIPNTPSYTPSTPPTNTTPVDTTKPDTVVETKPDGSTVETTTETKEDGTKVETVTETATDGSKTETVVETKPDGTKVETKTETATDGSKVETKKESETNTAGKQVDVATVTKTDADGKVASVVEKSTINEVAKNTTATVTVKKDSEGAVTSATASVAATIEGKKTSLSADVIAQVQEASGQKDVAVTVTAKNDEGKTLYKVKVDAKDLTADNALYIYKVDSKTGELVMVNSKTYKVDENGGLDISIKNKATYELVSKAEAKAIEKQIKATVKVQNSSKDVKKGKTTKVAFDKKMNMNNVKSITYQTADKKIATVSKSGKVTAKAKGTVTVKATVTLKNGSKKTVTMKIKVK